jgi:hypothetical protein
LKGRGSKISEKVEGVRYSTVAKLGNVAKLRNLTFAWFMSDVLRRNEAKAPKYFKLYVILICHAEIHVFTEIGTADIGVMSGFQIMEHSKSQVPGRITEHHISMLH